MHGYPLVKLFFNIAPPPPHPLYLFTRPKTRSRPSRRRARKLLNPIRFKVSAGGINLAENRVNQRMLHLKECVRPAFFLIGSRITLNLFLDTNCAQYCIQRQIRFSTEF